MIKVIKLSNDKNQISHCCFIFILHQLHTIYRVYYIIYFLLSCFAWFMPRNAILITVSYISKINILRRTIKRKMSIMLKLINKYSCS